jgi:hypothetical protein
VRILAIDGGLASAGFAVVDTWTLRGYPSARAAARREVQVTHAEVFRSKPASKKKRKATGLHVAVDRVSRARTLASRISGLVTEWNPDVVAAEEINHMRGIIANVSAGLFWGALVAVCEIHGRELQSVRVQEWRAFARESLRPLKDDEEGIHRSLHCNVTGASDAVNAIVPPSAQEHALDAIGVGWWAAHHA